jgi:hypothetical protein
MLPPSKPSALSPVKLLLGDGQLAEPEVALSSGGFHTFRAGFTFSAKDTLFFNINT